MILIFKPDWIVVGLSILIGIFAYKKDKNPLLLGGLNYLTALAIIGLVIFVDPLWQLWFVKLGLSEYGLYSFGAFTVSGAFYGYLQNVDDDHDGEEDEEDDDEENEEEIKNKKG